MAVCAVCLEEGCTYESHMGPNPTSPWPSAPDILQAEASKVDTPVSSIYRAETILEEAARIVDGGNREEISGNPRVSFERISEMWQAILNCSITPQQVGLCMIALKLVRENHKHTRDNLVDIAGYARCVERTLE
jgi:hypothetical protein